MVWYLLVFETEELGQTFGLDIFQISVKYYRRKGRIFVQVTIFGFYSSFMKNRPIFKRRQQCKIYGVARDRLKFLHFYPVIEKNGRMVCLQPLKGGPRTLWKILDPPLVNCVTVRSQIYHYQNSNGSIDHHSRNKSEYVDVLFELAENGLWNLSAIYVVRFTVSAITNDKNFLQKS